MARSLLGVAQRDLMSFERTGVLFAFRFDSSHEC